MKEIIFSVDFLLPLFCITLLIFFSLRLSSIMNFPFHILKSEFNIAFVFGKISAGFFYFLVIAFLIVSFINGSYLIPIIATVVGVILGYILASYKQLGPSADIPRYIMTVNCVSISIVFIVLLIYIFTI